MTSEPHTVPFDGQMVTVAQRFILEAIETHWRGHLEPPTLRELSAATGIDYRMTHYHVSVLRGMELVTMEPRKSRTLRTSRMLISTVLCEMKPYQAVFWGDGGYEVKDISGAVKRKAPSVKENPGKVKEKP